MTLGELPNKYLWQIENTIENVSCIFRFVIQSAFQQSSRLSNINYENEKKIKQNFILII